MGIQVGDNFDHKSKKPLDGRIQYATLALMKAVTDANIYEGCEAYCVETDKYYKFLSSNTVDETTGKWRERESGGGGTPDYSDLTNKPQINSVVLSGNKSASDLKLQGEMQFTAMPTAGADYLGKVVQFLGATDSTYTHGYYYECVSDGASTPTYSWSQTNVQPSSGGGTSDYTDLTNKPQIEGVTLSGNKSASDLGLVTKVVNDLVNYYLKSETYSKTEVDNIVTAIKNSRFEVVATLPTSNIKTNVIYLVPSSDPQTANAKDEYINLDGTTAGWELIGNTNIDLSGYVTTTDLNTALASYTTTTDLTTLLAAKQDKIQVSSMPTASVDYLGKLVQFLGTTDASYTHGYYYECVSDGEATPTYSWQQTNVQPNSGGGGSYTAGTGIDINNNVISTKQSQSGDIDEIVDVTPSPTPQQWGVRLPAQTLAVGSTSLTFQDSSIKADSTVYPFNNKWGVAPYDVVVTTGQAVLLFEPLEIAVSFYIVVV